MAGSAKDGRHGPIDPGALDLLPVAIQMVAEMGDANEADRKNKPRFRLEVR